MKMKTLLALAISGICAAGVANAHDHMAKPAGPSIDVKVQQLDPANGNKDVGTVTITESNYGLVFTPNLQGLAEGLHGFHIHENPSCDPKQHGYPWQDDAHLGDLPALTVLHDGTATNPVLAPRLKKLDEVRGHSIMIHAGGDNHSDHPAPLGGGGPRMACGVIK